MHRLRLVVVVVMVVGCGAPVGEPDAAAVDASVSSDAGPFDAGMSTDAGAARDAGTSNDAGIDAGTQPDAGALDAGQLDGGSADAGLASDAGALPDAGPPPDAGTLDAGQLDGGPVDAGLAFDGGPTLDAGRSDAGPIPDGGTPWVFSDAGVPPLLGGVARGSVRFRSRPTVGTLDNAGVLTALPPTFGTAEFTFELWFLATDLDRIPPGAGYDRRLDWATTDLRPASADNWWYDGNFLLDGHNNSTVSDGTFSLQLFGRGRVRWDFGDGPSQPLGGHHSVQVWPATLAPSTLDGAWHHVACVRRFPGASGAQLELWVDGRLQATTSTPNRTNLQQWWATWANFPMNQPGFFFGAEKISARGGAIWDSFKGRVSELRFWSRARSATELSAEWRNALSGTEPGLVGWYDFREGQGTQVCDRVVPSRCMTLERMISPWW